MDLKWATDKIENILLCNGGWKVTSKKEDEYEIYYSNKNEILDGTMNLTIKINSSTIDMLSCEGDWKGVGSYNELEKAIDFFTSIAKCKGRKNKV